MLVCDRGELQLIAEPALHELSATERWSLLH